MAAFDLKYLQNSLRRTWMLRQPLFFTYWLPKHPFFDSPLFPTTVSQVTFGYLPLTMQHLCDLLDISHTIDHQVLPTPAFNVIPHPFVSNCQVFRPILYFQPSSSQSDLRQFPTQPFPRKVKNFPRGGNDSKHEPLLTYLI